MDIKSELEDISNILDVIADDESVISLPKVLKKLRERVDVILEELENQGKDEEEEK